MNTDPTSTRQTYGIAGWVYKPASSCLVGSSETRVLTPLLNRLLLAFVLADEQTLGRDAMVDAAWARSVVTDDAIARAVSDLRKLLSSQAFPEPIHTLHGFGYRLDAGVETRAEASKLRWLPAAALIIAVAIGLGLGRIYLFRDPAPALVNVPVNPMSVYNQLDAAHQYLPVTGQLVSVRQVRGGQDVVVQSGETLRTLASNRNIEALESSPDGQSLALLDVTNGCEVHVLGLESGAETTAGPCLRDAGHAIAWSASGHVLLGQLREGNLSVSEFRNGMIVSETAAAPDCRRLGHVQRTAAEETFVSCQGTSGDSLYQLQDGLLTEILRYRSIEKFLVDESGSFYLLHAPRWKAGITRFTPPDQFTFLQTGWVLDISLDDDHLALVRDLGNNDLLVLDLNDHVLEGIEESPVSTRAFTLDDMGTLWQLDDRNGSLELFRQGEPIDAPDHSMADFDFADVECMAVDNEANIIEFSVETNPGQYRLVRHDLATGVMLKSTDDSDRLACPPPLPDAIGQELKSMRLTPRTALFDPQNNRVLFIQKRTAYMDIASIELSQLPD